MPWGGGPSINYTSIPRSQNAAAAQPKASEVVNSFNPIRASAMAFDKYCIYGGLKEIKVFEVETGQLTSSITGNFGYVNVISIVYGTTTLIVTAHDDGRICWFVY